MQTESIRELIHSEFEQMNEIVENSLITDVPLIKTICEHIIKSGGKRLRPMLVLLVAKALGRCQKEHCQLAAIIEFLHTATLLHDDVIDESDLRRGKQTANHRWGNRPSILVGDFLLSRTLQMMVAIDNIAIIKQLADTTNTITTGEMLQLTNRRNVDANKAYYLHVIRCKTAALFATACESAASLLGQPKHICQAMREYGESLGIAFQLADDALDYAGDSDVLGKQVGDDLAEGKPTLPLIIAMEKGGHETKQMIQQALQSGHGEDFKAVCDAVQQTGALDETYRLASEYAEKANQQLNVLSESTYKTALASLSQYAVKRNI